MSSEKLESLANSNNRFTFSLFRHVAADNHDNIFFSPFSINAALAMTFAGARGATAAEMRETLKITDTSDTKFHQSFKEVLTPILKKKHSNIKFRVANRIYVQNKFPIQAEFQKLLEEHYFITAALVDFITQTDAVKEEINGWVEKQTEKKITDLIGPGILDDSTRLVLVNAVYFKGDWKKKFNSKFTHPGEFYLDLEKVVTIDMMFQKGNLPYAYSEELGCSILEVPYVNDNFSLMLILPNELEGLTDVESKLDNENLKKLISCMKGVQVDLRLPKFKLTSEMGLSDSLSKLGMTSLFTEAADLSGMTGARDLYVSAVLHKAFLEVNEEGSEAAAATAVVCNLRCAVMGTEFIVNHPFLLMIRDTTSGIILFMGRVTDPSKLG